MAWMSIGALVFYLWVQTAANETVIGIIGSSVNLPCIDDQLQNDFKIHWKKGDEISCYVDAYIPGIKSTDQCEDFKNRTSFIGHLEQGNFTLRLSDIGPKDELTYKCIILQKVGKQYHKKNESHIALKVAANYSKPTVTKSMESGKQIFTCHSSGGYPKQRIYWRNITDNSLLNASEHVIEEPDGKLNISSILTLAAPDPNLECIVENELLHQKLTTTTTEICNSSVKNHSPPSSHAVIWVLIVAAIVIIVICGSSVYWNNIATVVHALVTSRLDYSNVLVL